MEIDVRRRLAALDVLAAAIDMLAECVGEPRWSRCARIHLVELDEATALGSHGGSDLTKSTAPATARSLPSCAHALLLHPLVKFVRKGPPIRCSIAGDEIVAG